MGENGISSELQEEFNKLFREYQSKILRYVMVKIKDKNLAEDIVQEIFYEAWRHLDTVKNHPNKIGWLYQTATYKMREFMRSVKQSEEYSMNADEMQMPMEEGGYSKAEFDMMIYETLTPDEQLRFRRYFLWGESIAEMADKENISENNMRVRISRLKKKMEDAIKLQ